jgi:hypothetical protein
VEACGCAQFFMVREQTMKICGVMDEKCFWQVEEELENKKDSCNCLETCDTLKYDVEIIKDAII